MQKTKRMLVVGLTLLGIASSGWAEERGTKDEAKALADRAAAYVAQVGPEKAFKDFNDKSAAQWRNKDLYVFAYNLKGDCLANGANSQLVGKNLIDMKDPEGKPIIREMIAAVGSGSGAVDYNWPHPLTKKIEDKTSYVVKVPNYDGFVGVGAYR